MKNITFSEQIKQELCNVKYSKECQKYILLSFIINKFKINLTNENKSIIIESSFSFIIRYIGELIKCFFKIVPTYSYSDLNSLSQSRTYRLNINDNNFYQSIISTYQQWFNIDFFNKLENEEKKGILIGAFLSNGSINPIEKSTYHLEFRSQNINYLRIIQKIMIGFHFAPSLLGRKYWSCLYIKRANEISDVLKIMGANNSMHLLEEKIIERDFSNQLQRLNNLDVSNMNRAIRSGKDEVMMINAIKKHPEIYKNASHKFQNFCTLRLKNPSATLQELCVLFQKKYHTEITKSCANHYVIKMRKVYNQIKK